MTRLSPRVTQALVDAAAVMQGACHDWWIIGSAAVALLGGDTTVADIDLLIDRRDGEALMARLGIGPLESDRHDRSRSQLFARWTASTMPVEIMADLHVAHDDQWHRVTLTTRRAVSIGHVDLFVPQPPELITLLHRFGRPKDRHRAALLEAATL